MYYLSCYSEKRSQAAIKGEGRRSAVICVQKKNGLGLTFATVVYRVDSSFEDFQHREVQIQQHQGAIYKCFISTITRLAKYWLQNYSSASTNVHFSTAVLRHLTGFSSLQGNVKHKCFQIRDLGITPFHIFLLSYNIGLRLFILSVFIAGTPN